MINVVTWRRRIVIALIAAGVGWGLYSGFRPQPVAVDLGAATRGPLRVSIEQEGRTRVVNRYVITAPVAAWARRIDLEAGDPVRGGAPVARLEPQRAEVLDVRRRAESESRVAAAEANVGAARQREQAALAGADLARKSLDRMRVLRASGHVTAEAEDRARAESDRADSELRSARFSGATARHELEAARTALRYAAAGGAGSPILVTSPVDGRVLKIDHKSEGAVAMGQPLLEIGDPRDLEVEVDVLSADAVRIHPGIRVLLERWGGEKPLEGRVRVIEPAGFTKVSALGVEEQRVWVIVSFTSPATEWQRLGDGYRVEAAFVIWESPDVLQIPASALFRDGDGWAAYVVDEGRAVKRRIEAGRRNGLAAQVLSGIREGEQVVVHPDDRLRDGVVVKSR